MRDADASIHFMLSDETPVTCRVIDGGPVITLGSGFTKLQITGDRESARRIAETILRAIYPETAAMADAVGEVVQ